MQFYLPLVLLLVSMILFFLINEWNFAALHIPFILISFILGNILFERFLNDTPRVTKNLPIQKTKEGLHFVENNGLIIPIDGRFQTDVITLRVSGDDFKHDWLGFQYDMRDNFEIAQ